MTIISIIPEEQFRIKNICALFAL